MGDEDWMKRLGRSEGCWEGGGRGGERREQATESPILTVFF